MINKLNEVIKNIDIYYNINYNIYKNYDKKYINYEILHNNILNDINKINEDNNVINKFKEILNIYKKMNNNDIELIYNINDEDRKRGKIKIFCKSFVNNYKNICKIIIIKKILV